MARSFEEVSRLTIRLKENQDATHDHLIAGCQQRIANATEKQANAAERQAVAAEKQLEETRALNGRLTRMLAKYEDVLRSNTSLKGKITTLRAEVNKLKAEKGGANA